MDIDGKGNQLPYEAEISDFNVENGTYKVEWLKSSVIKNAGPNVL